MNKPLLILIVSICLILLLAAGCTANSGSGPSSVAVPEVSPTPAKAPEADSISEFSVGAVPGNISLQAWDNEVDLSFLGTPVLEEVRVLDQTADTFAGSHVKNVKYDGIELELFSPKGNGESFWIKEIVITGESYITPRGLGVGSSIEKMQELYPEIQQVPDGRTDPDNCAYIYKSTDGFSNISFEVMDTKIINFRIYYEMP